MPLTHCLPVCICVCVCVSVCLCLCATSAASRGVWFGQLEVLHLSNNRITDIAAIGLHLLPELKVLNLSGNEITRLTGLNSCTSLRELVVEKNKIRDIDPTSFVGLEELRELRLQVTMTPPLVATALHNVVLLFAVSIPTFVASLLFSTLPSFVPSFVGLISASHFLQENGLRSLSNIDPLTSVQILSLSHNRIRYGHPCRALLSTPHTLRLAAVHGLVCACVFVSDFVEIDKLAALPCLTELTVNSNAVSRKPIYRPYVIRKLPGLCVLDGTTRCPATAAARVSSEGNIP